ncbi:ribosome biogenesis protein NOP53 isoform X1 [Ascaphus truei]|uniref:ribosome biogenesis protein NOP53 isoform X1 n=1 Tax=Ascaphus truei TaxID=8439 RepID=UPI003F5AB00F
MATRSGVDATFPGFLGFGPGSKAGGKSGGKAPRRKRVNRNKKSNWGRHSDVRDVEAFLDDIRLQERTAGGLLAEKEDESLFYVDTGNDEKDVKTNKRTKPLRIDLILQSDSKVPVPKDISSHQIPNGRKLKRRQELRTRLEKRGILSRPERLLNAQLGKTRPKCRAEANNQPDRGFYDIWGELSPLDSALEGKDSWYLEQTQKSRVKRPAKMNIKPSQLSAVEVLPSGASYNPSFESHQALLLQAHEEELKKVKEEEKLQNQLRFPTVAEAPTERNKLEYQASKFLELCEGLMEESEDETAPDEEAGKEQGLGFMHQREKKTERQRKKEKEAKFRKARLLAEKAQRQKKQEVFQLRSIRSELKERQSELARRKEQRVEKQKAEATQPRRLGRLKYKELDTDVQLSEELAGSLRKLKPEGSILKDRFKSLQKRNLIEPRERAKFKRKLKVKYLEKRAFREITL